MCFWDISFVAYLIVLQSSPICNQMSVLGQYPGPDALCSEAVRLKLLLLYQMGVSGQSLVLSAKSVSVIQIAGRISHLGVARACVALVMTAVPASWVRELT